MAHLFLLLLLLVLFLLPTLTSSTDAPLPSDLTRILRSSGYSLSAATLSSAARAAAAQPRRRHFLHGWNATGTLFLPVDSTFRNRRLPSASLFLYHAARLPPLRFSDLSSLPSGSPIPTFSRRRRCLFVRRTPSGVPCLGTSYGRSLRPCVSILHPDLFLSGDLAIHGVDGVLDPAAASGCHPAATWRAHSHLDRAVRALRRRGYAGVAGEMERLRAELAGLPAVTVFAPRGHALPRRYDLRRHVVPRRYRLLDLMRLPEGGRIGTLAANSTVAIGKAAPGGVTANGIPVEGKELFRNGWAVVLAIQRMFPISDDVADQVSEEVDYPGLAGDYPTETGREPEPGAPSPAVGDGGELPSVSVEEATGWRSGDEDHGAPAAMEGDYRRRLGGTVAPPVLGGAAPSPLDDVHVEGGYGLGGIEPSDTAAYGLWWDPL